MAGLNGDETRFDHRISPGTSILLAGCSGSGKTTVILNMLRNLNDYFTFEPSEIYYIHSGIPQEAFEEFKNTVSFFDGWSHFPLECLKTKSHWILVIDDVYQRDKVPVKGLIAQIVSVLCHHCHGVFLLPIHNYHSKSLDNAGEVALQCSLFFFLQSPSMRSVLNSFAHQFFGSEKNRFLELHDAIVNIPHSALTYDARIRTPNHLGLSTKFVSPQKRSLDENEIENLTDEELKKELNDAGPIFFIPKNNIVRT